MKTALVTGSGGLIGSEAVRYFAARGFAVRGIDNDMRSYFFGPGASTRPNIERLQRDVAGYEHHAIDIRDKMAVRELFSANRFDVIVHCAAQPSHDWASREPETDFEINANGTLNLLLNFRNHAPGAVFIFTSTNKVYGDTPNRLGVVELESRYELPVDHRYYEGIDESMAIDHSMHSIFGVSKTAADLMVQEFGRYYGLRTGTFRGGCLTGPAHAGAELHGFLAYLVKCVATDTRYTIFGYKGKQVRDNIHSHDLVRAFWSFYECPRIGEVYNIGGSRHSNVSILEAIASIEKHLGREADVAYEDRNRIGDHIWYISDVRKFREHYPGWRYEYGSEDIIAEMCASVRNV